jgi:hypothetical protein
MAYPASSLIKAWVNNGCNPALKALIPVGMDHLLGKDYRSPVHVPCFFGRPNRAKPSIIGRMKLRLGSEPPPLGKNPGRYIYSWPQGTAQTTHECHHPSTGTGEKPQNLRIPREEFIAKGIPENLSLTGPREG